MAKRRINWFVRMLLWGIAVLFALFLATDLFLHIFTQHGVSTAVPDMVGKDLATCEQLSRKDDLNLVVIDSVYVDKVPKGTVYMQNPKAGERVKRGRKIYLTVNASRHKQTSMPDLVGLSLRQARVELSSQGLRTGRLVYVGDMATNNVLGQLIGGENIAAGTRLDVGTVVDLKLGLNPSDGYTSVPDFSAMNSQKAREELLDASLNLDGLYYDSTVGPADSLSAFVYRQIPAPLTRNVIMGTAVRLYLTMDPDKLPKVGEEQL